MSTTGCAGQTGTRASSTLRATRPSVPGRRATRSGVTARELMRELAGREFAYELITHARTMTAGDEAEAFGIPCDEVAKTLVVATDSGHLRAVLPASERLDMHKLRALVEDATTV